MPRENQSIDKVVNAFIELVDEKGYGDLTITDIARRAGVSRMTFYRQFSSKEDVAKRFVETVGERLARAVESEPGVWAMRDYFYILFKDISAYSKVIKELYFGNLGEFILSCMNRILFRTPIKQGILKFDRYKTVFYAGAFYNVIIEWILSGMQEPAEDMAELCCGLIA